MLFRLSLMFNPWPQYEHLGYSFIPSQFTLSEQAKIISELGSFTRMEQQHHGFRLREHLESPIQGSILFQTHNTFSEQTLSLFNPWPQYEHLGFSFIPSQFTLSEQAKIISELGSFTRMEQQHHGFRLREHLESPIQGSILFQTHNTFSEQSTKIV